jgi:hypothetical protein
VVEREAILHETESYSALSLMGRAHRITGRARWLADGLRRRDARRYGIPAAVHAFPALRVSAAGVVCPNEEAMFGSVTS